MNKIRQKAYIIPGVNIINGKANVAGLKGAGCALSHSAWNLVGGAP